LLRSTPEETNIDDSTAQSIRELSTHEVFLVIADYHTLTTHYRREAVAQMSENIRAMVLDYLSVGLDPEKTTIYVQSQVPQVCELLVILSMNEQEPGERYFPIG